jgi:hypothetical protein
MLRFGTVAPAVVVVAPAPVVVVDSTDGSAWVVLDVSMVDVVVSKNTRLDVVVNGSVGGVTLVSSSSPLTVNRPMTEARRRAAAAAPANAGAGFMGGKV